MTPQQLRIRGRRRTSLERCTAGRIRVGVGRWRSSSRGSLAFRVSATRFTCGVARSWPSTASPRAPDLLDKGSEFLAALALREAPRRRLDSLIALIDDLDRKTAQTTARSTSARHATIASRCSTRSTVWSLHRGADRRRGSRRRFRVGQRRDRRGSDRAAARAVRDGTRRRGGSGRRWSGWASRGDGEPAYFRVIATRTSGLRPLPSIHRPE